MKIISRFTYFLAFRISCHPSLGSSVEGYKKKREREKENHEKAECEEILSWWSFFLYPSNKPANCVHNDRKAAESNRQCFAFGSRGMQADTDLGTYF